MKKEPVIEWMHAGRDVENTCGRCSEGGKGHDARTHDAAPSPRAGTEWFAVVAYGPCPGR